MVTEEVLHHIDYQKCELLVIESFENVRERNGEVEFEVKWRGFNKAENDWLSLEGLREDVPVMIAEQLTDMAATGTPRQRAIAKRLVSLWSDLIMRQCWVVSAHNRPLTCASYGSQNTCSKSFENCEMWSQKSNCEPVMDFEWHQ